ncbi:MAG: methyltransferase family protein [Actinomycetales bacterium]
MALPWPWRTGIAVVLVSAALSLGIAAVLSFRRAKTTIHPLNPSHTSAVVVAGVYRASRNPMYLAMLIGLVAISVMLASPLALVLASGFVPLMNAVQVRPEERILADRFGDPYLEYCRQVRRWV